MSEKELQVIDIENALVEFNLPEAVIAEKRESYKDLVIKDINDKPGFELVHKARIDMKNLRVAVQKRGKELRASAIKWSNKVIAEEKRLIGQIEPIEDRLADEESRVTEEIARIKAEAEAKVRAMLQARANKLFDMGCRYNGHAYTYAGVEIADESTIKVSTDTQFNVMVAELQSLLDEEAKEKEREALAKAEQEAELKRVAEEQARKAAEQEAEDKRLADERKKIDEEKEAIEKAKKDIEDAELAKKKAEEDERKEAEDKKRRDAELESAKQEAADNARIAAEEKAKRDAEEQKKREEKARVAAERKAARQPDKKKIEAYLYALNSIVVPELKTEEGKAVMGLFSDGLEKLQGETSKQLEEL